MWSVTVYNKQGYMFALPANYNSRSQKATSNTTVFFGKCDDPSRQVPTPAHCLPTATATTAAEEGWGVLLRFFRPGKEILDGSWKIPVPEPDSDSAEAQRAKGEDGEKKGDGDDKTRQLQEMLEGFSTMKQEQPSVTSFML